MEEVGFWNSVNELMDSTQITPYTATVRLFISLLLGTIVGAERQMRRRDAGIRTFTLICMGSTVAMLISIWIPQTYTDFLNGDPGRIAAQVLTGIGFLGAGAIIQGHGSIHGLTTAACIWVMAAIGLGVGAGMYIPALVATILTLFVLISFEELEKRLFLSGVNKILTIHYSTASPDIKLLRKILEKKGVFIVSFSYENNYDEDTSIVTLKVNIKSEFSSAELFREIRNEMNVSQIRLIS